MPQKKNQGFLKGAAILSASTVIVKVISFSFSIPLTNAIGTAAMTPYSVTYQLFALFDAIATAGLPIALSKMISTAYTAKEPVNAEKIFSVALRAFAIFSLVLSLIMFFFSDALANLYSTPDASYSIKALAPTVFLGCILSAVRGFFQGKSNMNPTAISRLIEAIIKLIVGLSLALYIMAVWQNSVLASAGAILGVSISAGIASVYLLLRKRRDKRETLQAIGPEDSTRVDTAKTILKNLIKIAIPITIGSCLLFALDNLDTMIINSILNRNFEEEIAKDMYGSWSTALKLFDLPGAITSSIATSLFPLIAAAYWQNDVKRVTRNTSSAMRITLLISIPCTIGYILYGGPLAGLIYRGDNVSSDKIGSLLQTAALAITFNGLLYATNSILQALGHVTTPVINMTIGGVIRIGLNYLLISNPAINIYGTAISASICYLIILILNLIALYRVLPKTENILRQVFPVLLSALVMGAVSYAVFFGLSQFLSPSIAVLPAVLVAVLVYFPTCILFRAVERSDIVMLPKGEKLADLFHLYEGAHFG